MRYIVDRIEEGIIVLENYEDGSMTEINKSEINFKVSPSDILICENNVFRLDNDFKKERLNYITNLFEDLKSNNEED